MTDIFQTIIVYALPVIFAITLHEAAHAYAAKYFGDNTAYAAGRMTIDPFKHIDLFGTIIMPVALYVISSGAFTFGYAKPVPVDFSRLRNPKKQMAFVAAAGPLANFAMALAWMCLGIAAGGGEPGFLAKVAHAGIIVNIMMFIFNLMPIPPLDGGRIVTSMLPMPMARKYAQLEPYGIFIVLGLVAFHVLDGVLMFFASWTHLALTLLTYPLRLLF
jgi:Zn-dependent protease